MPGTGHRSRAELLHPHHTSWPGALHVGDTQGASSAHFKAPVHRLGSLKGPQRNKVRRSRCTLIHTHRDWPLAVYSASPKHGSALAVWDACTHACEHKKLLPSSAPDWGGDDKSPGSIPRQPARTAPQVDTTVKLHFQFGKALHGVFLLFFFGPDKTQRPNLETFAHDRQQMESGCRPQSALTACRRHQVCRGKTISASAAVVGQ